MSTEIVSKGNNFSIKKLDRFYRGKSKDVLTIDGTTGAVNFTGVVKINGAAVGGSFDGNLTGNLHVTGTALVDGVATVGALVSNGDASVDGLLDTTDTITAPSLNVGTNKLHATTVGVAFYGKAVAAQPSSTGTATGFTAGAGTPVLDDSTFTGAVGATAYRLSDIVKHLKNLGLIAS